MCDLISRQAAIETLNGTIEVTGRENAETVKNYVKLVADRLAHLPSAQKHGKWEIGNDPMIIGFAKCSECGAVIDTDLADIFLYCPSCGAAMEVGICVT